jgi:hypothetical protein
MNPFAFACSVGWQWTKVGLIGAARGIKNGWNTITTDSTSSRSSASSSSGTSRQNDHHN